MPLPARDINRLIDNAESDHVLAGREKVCKRTVVAVPHTANPALERVSPGNLGLGDVPYHIRVFGPCCAIRHGCVRMAAPRSTESDEKAARKAKRCNTSGLYIELLSIAGTATLSNLVGRIWIYLPLSVGITHILVGLFHLFEG